MTGLALLPTTDAVPAEVVSFLAQFAVALHKQRAYPPGHPMRKAAQQLAYASLQSLLATRTSFRIGVARDQLVIEGNVTDPGHFIIGDLADRLHRRQLGSIVFRAGLPAEELATFLEVLVAGGTRGRQEPISPADVEGEYIEITQIAFDALELRLLGDVGVQIDRLWQELAVTVAGGQFGGGGGEFGGLGGSDQGSGPVGGFTQMLLERLGVPEVRATVASTVERLGRLTQTLEGDERVVAETRLRDLLATLPPEALGMLLDIDLGRRDTMGNLLPAVEWLPAMALVEIVETAARSQSKEISGVLLRLLQKMARQSSRGPSGRAPKVSDRDLRLVVKGLLEDWSLSDPNSKSHAHILEVLSKHEMVSASDGAPFDESIRLIQMGIEVGSLGDHVTEAVEGAVAAGETDELVALLGGVEFGEVSLGIWRLLAEPQQLRRILADDQVSEEAVLAVLDHVGPDATTILIDRLLGRSQGALRPRIAERLMAMGPAASAALRARVDTIGPEGQSKLLGLLAQLAELPEWFDVTRYLDADEPAVRVEAYRLAFRRPDLREDAIHDALADLDDRVVKVAVEHGQDSCPRQSVPRLLRLLNSPQRSVALKAEIVELLNQFDEPSIREWLIGGLVARRRWWRLRRRLVPTDPVVLAKVRVLRDRWLDDPKVVGILRLARRSGDAELVAAANPNPSEQ